MNNFFRTIIAAWGAKKLGGGCLSTIIIFVVIYSLLGKCNNQPARAENRPAATEMRVKRVLCQPVAASNQTVNSKRR